MSDVSDALYEHRLLVLMETSEGTFRQVLVNAKQFKNISDNTGTPMPDDGTMKPGFQVFNTFFKENFELDADLFIGCESITDDAYFKED